MTQEEHDKIQELLEAISNADINQFKTVEAKLVAIDFKEAILIAKIHIYNLFMQSQEVNE